MSSDYLLISSKPPKKDSFNLYLLLSVALFLFLGYSFSKVKDLPRALNDKITQIKTTFDIKEKIVVKPKPKKKVKKAKPLVKPKEPKKVYDLTKKPKLKAKEDKIVEKPAKKTPRKVYGVKKVYSKGLGAGGNMSDAVVGKRGNTVNAKFDTVTATDADILGEVVSAVTVTKAPSFKKKVKPIITEEIRKNGIQGVIKVKILVDIDGNVKRAIAKNDLGFGSKKAAVDACLKMEFYPAKKLKEPVAVWIIIPVRFEKLGS